MINMNKKLLIIIALIVLFVFMIILLSVFNRKDVPYTDITYSARGEWACLTFYKNGKYSLYDCDSEPTDYFFDSENECTYKYFSNNKIIKFKCKYKTKYKHRDYIKILEWDNKHIKFDYEGKKKTFYSINSNY